MSLKEALARLDLALDRTLELTVRPLHFRVASRTQPLRSPRAAHTDQDVQNVDTPSLAPLAPAILQGRAQVPMGPFTAAFHTPAGMLLRDAEVGEREMFNYVGFVPPPFAPMQSQESSTHLIKANARLT